MGSLCRPRIQKSKTPDVSGPFFELKASKLSHRFSDDHLKKCHRTFDCPTCLEPFDDANEFACHKGDGSCNSTNIRPAPQRDGIKPQQWKDIEKVTKIHTSKSYTDVKKWMEIWKIIFPNVDQPKYPCRCSQIK